MTTLQRISSDQRKSALTAGVSLIFMAIAAFFAFGYVHGSLVVQGDASATFDNLKSSSILFKAEIFGWLIVLILDIVVAWAFYIFLMPIHKSLSLLGAWLRLSYASILGIALLNLIVVSLLINSPEHLSLFDSNQLQVLVMLFLNAFTSIWSIGLIIFGGHLMVIGYLAFQSNTIPKAISILLLLASIGYIVIHLCRTFLPQFDGFITILEMIFSVPMIAGELGFGIWLLFKGGKNPQNL